MPTKKVFEELNEEIRVKKMSRMIDNIVKDYKSELHTLAITWMKAKTDEEKVILSNAIYKHMNDTNKLQRQLKTLKVKNFFTKLIKDIRG